MSESMMCCPLSGNDGDQASVSLVTTPKAGKAHQCCECGDAIPRGAKHELYKLLSDGRWSAYRTCLLCVEIRNHFACDGWIFQYLWSDLQDNFFPEMKAGGGCMEGLSPAAKARLFEKRLEWVFSHDEYDPCDQAVPPWLFAEILRRRAEAIEQRRNHAFEKVIAAFPERADEEQATTSQDTPSVEANPDNGNGEG